MGFSLSSWLFRKRVKAEVQWSGRPVQQHRVVNPYHAVSIAPGIGCCQSAQSLTGKRFLSAEAPQMPLRDCNTKSCTCRYVHHDDRRSIAARRNRDVWNKNAGFVRSDRRRSPGRRAMDH
jgi:hypothetical protein